MARHRLSVALALAAVIIAALGLSACGRKGPLELPPGPATGSTAATPAQPSGSFLPSGLGSPATSDATADTGVKTGFDAQGNPVAAPGQKKSFILDPLMR